MKRKRRKKHVARTRLEATSEIIRLRNALTSLEDRVRNLKARGLILQPSYLKDDERI